MVDLVTLQSLSYIAGAIGVCVAAFYYIMTLRENKNNRRMQFLLQNLSDNLNEQGYNRYVTLMNMEWKDYDDFEKKYGSDNNPEAYSKRLTAWTYYNNLGYLISQGFIDADMLFDMNGDGIIWAWMKWEPILKEIRVRYNQPELAKWFDYCADRLLEVRRRRGVSVELPRTFMKYTPEKRAS